MSNLSDSELVYLADNCRDPQTRFEAIDELGRRYGLQEGEGPALKVWFRFGRAVAAVLLLSAVAWALVRLAS